MSEQYAETGAGPHITYTRPAGMVEAVCTCGWKQLHYNVDNAVKDADEHQQFWHAEQFDGLPDA